jgi:hypothetical protein
MEQSNRGTEAARGRTVDGPTGLVKYASDGIHVSWLKRNAIEHWKMTQGDGSKERTRERRD